MTGFVLHGHILFLYEQGLTLTLSVLTDVWAEEKNLQTFDSLLLVEVLRSVHFINSFHHDIKIKQEPSP